MGPIVGDLTPARATRGNTGWNLRVVVFIGERRRRAGREEAVLNTDSMMMGLMGGFGLIWASGLLWVLTRWSASEQLGSNPVAGIRTAATTASSEAWTAGHRAALPWARRIGVFGMILGVALVATAFLPVAGGSKSQVPHPLSVAFFAVGYGGLLLGCVPLVRTANKAARQAQPER